MKVLNNLTLKYLKLNKKKMLVTIVGIILTSTLLFTMGLGASTIRQVGIEGAINYSGSQHVIFKDLPYSNVDILQKDSSIEKIIVEEVIDFYDYELYSEKYTSNIVSTNISYDDYIMLSSGRLPVSENEVIISFSFARNNNFNLNDSIKDYSIVGIYKGSKLHHYDYNGNYVSSDDYIYVGASIIEKNNVNFYVTYSSLKNIFEKLYNTADSLNLEYKIDNKDSEYRKYNNTSINYNLLGAYGKYESHRNQLALYLTLGLILLVLSSACILVIFNAFTISLSERKKHIGILRSVGATTKQLYKSIFFEASLLGVISIPIGIVLSFLLTNGVLLVINKMLESIIAMPYKLSIHPSFMIISFIFILVTIYLSAFFSVYVTGDSSAIELIRMNDDIDIKKRKDNKLIRYIFGFEGELAYKNIKRNKSKYSIAVTSLCISIVLFITFATFINYILRNNEYDVGSNYDIHLSVPDVDVQNEIINGISKISEIDEVVLYKYFTLYFKSLSKDMVTTEYYDYVSNKSFDRITIYGLDSKIYNSYKNKVGLKDNSKVILYNHMDYYDIDLEKNITKKLDFDVFKEEVLNLEICDVEVKFSNFNERLDFELNECYLTIHNIFLTNHHFMEKNGGFSIIVNMDQYNEIKKLTNIYSKDDEISDNYIQIGINAKRFKEVDNKISKIIDKYPNVDVYYNNHKLDNYNQYMSIMAFKFLLYSIVIFVTIIAITSVFNTINTSIILREREFSMFRSVGLSNHGLNKMIKLESIFLGIKTILYGIPLSLLIVFVVYLIDFFAQKKITMMFPTKYFVICFIGVIAIIFLTMRYSARKIKDKNIIDSIRKENI